MHAIILKYIDSVARAGSMRRAAEQLNVAASAVNRQIINLEHELGTRLFERNPKGLTITPAGEVVVRHARETLAKSEEMRNEIAALRGELRGEVRIISIPSAMVDIVPGALLSLAQKHPGITSHAVNLDVNAIATEMRTGGPDAAVLFIERRYRDYEIVERLGARIGVLMRHDHPLASRRAISLSECAEYPVVMLNGPWLVDQISQPLFAERDIEFKSQVTTNSLELTKRVIQGGLGLGFFTPTGFVSELKSGQFVHVPLSEKTLAEHDIGLFVNRTRRNHVHIKALVQEFSAVFAAAREEFHQIDEARTRLFDINSPPSPDAANG